jgi:hypothetical protein
MLTMKKPGDLVPVMLLLAISCSTATAAADHTVSVRMLDARNGKPLKRHSVGLEIGRNRAILNAKTNSEGIASFHLNDPVPERIWLVFAPFEMGICSEIQFSTDEVLRAGSVGRNTCISKIQYAVAPKAGEIVAFGKPVSLWHRILGETP